MTHSTPLTTLGPPSISPCSNPASCRSTSLTHSTLTYRARTVLSLPPLDDVDSPPFIGCRLVPGVVGETKESGVAIPNPGEGGVDDPGVPVSAEYGGEGSDEFRSSIGRLMTMNCRHGLGRWFVWKPGGSLPGIGGSSLAITSSTNVLGLSGDLHNVSESPSEAAISLSHPLCDSHAPI